ncbi:LacI family DNA-binding transcriptional regulator [Ornithinimicrobium sp. Y1847]|uniref:LacI family DNA-binding transcriptional regulator n=1 Tax=unclassified Ornithinimicrobium TaxID=2615080 RepID=UPI003B66CCB0
MPTTPARPRATMYDVARVAGVSHQTVSRVVNGRSGVRAETIDRVRGAMDELAYVPNASARSLAARRSGVIGVISLNGPYFGPTSMLHSIESAVREHGYIPSVSSLYGCTSAQTQLAIAQLVERQVEGVVAVCPMADGPDLLAALPAGLPVVAVETDLGQGQPYVASDNLHGGRMVAEHLIALGHREMAHVTGPVGWAESVLRTQGWEEVLRSAGVPVREHLTGDWSARSGHAAGVQLAAMPEVTAVFVANDQMALGVLTALHEAGRRVPEDISVVGYDDIPEAAWLLPGLTTVEQRFVEVGRLGIDQMVLAIKGRAPEPEVLVRPTLIERASTAAPRAV